MHLLSTTGAFYGGLLVLSVYSVKRLLSSRRSTPYPPGPRGLPLIGNLLDWPSQKRCMEVFTHWRHVYGDITYLNVAGQPIIVLNSPRMAIETLERKGAIYSSRPYLYFVCKLVEWDKRSTVVAPYGEDHRRMRQMISKVIGTKALVDRFTPIHEHEAQSFVRRLIDAPSSDRLPVQIRNLANFMILNVSHGYQVADEDDPMVALAERAMGDFAIAGTPGAFLVDIFPFLDKLPVGFPGTGFRKVAAQMNKAADAFLNVPHAWVKEQMANGTAQPSFVSAQLEGKELSAADEMLVKAAAGAFFGAGSETSASAILSFFLAMVLNPAVQERARAEVDAVVGTDRLPTSADREHMPYVEAMCKEVLRWAPPVPLGGVRSLAQDDVTDGYFIPRGSIVFTNTWGFTRDPRLYSDPTSFNPSRFLPTDGSEPELDPATYVFGFGRRICSGVALFHAEFFITCATTLATLDLGKAVDDNGEIVEPEVEVEEGVFFMWKPFRCSIKPRSEKAENLVRELAT